MAERTPVKVDEPCMASGHSWVSRFVGAIDAGRASLMILFMILFEHAPTEPNSLPGGMFESPRLPTVSPPLSTDPEDSKGRLPAFRFEAILDCSCSMRSLAPLGHAKSRHPAAAASQGSLAESVSTGLAGNEVPEEEALLLTGACVEILLACELLPARLLLSALLLATASSTAAIVSSSFRRTVPTSSSSSSGRPVAGREREGAAPLRPLPHACLFEPDGAGGGTAEASSSDWGACAFCWRSVCGGLVRASALPPLITEAASLRRLFGAPPPRASDSMSSSSSLSACRAATSASTRTLAGFEALSGGQLADNTSLAVLGGTRSFCELSLSSKAFVACAKRLGRAT
mmetsp:Transcript_113641/g.253590  ORF Transcript_113641/g.253590 Transcript_113641/m.253590 type:complete len:345 (-) Transcript_113641:416-1450(-)